MKVTPNRIAGVPRSKMPAPGSGTVLSFLADANSDLRLASAPGGVAALYDDKGKPSPLLKTIITHFKDRFREVNKAVSKVAALKEHKKVVVATVSSAKGSFISLEQAWESQADVTEVAAALLTLQGEHKQRSKRVLTPTMVKAGISLHTAPSYRKEPTSEVAQDMLAALARLGAADVGLVACEFGGDRAGRLLVKAVLAFHNAESRPAADPAEDKAPVSPDIAPVKPEREPPAFQELNQATIKGAQAALNSWPSTFRKVFSNPKWSRFFAEGKIGIELVSQGSRVGLDPASSSAEALSEVGNATEAWDVQGFTSSNTWAFQFNWKPEVLAGIKNPLVADEHGLDTGHQGGKPEDLILLQLGRLHAGSTVYKDVDPGTATLDNQVFGLADASRCGGGKNVNLHHGLWDPSIGDVFKEALISFREVIGDVLLTDLLEWEKDGQEAPLRELAELSWEQSVAGGGFYDVKVEGRGYRAKPWVSQSEVRLTGWDRAYAEPLLRAAQRALDGTFGRDMYLAVDVDPSDGSVYLERDINHPNFRD